MKPAARLRRRRGLAGLFDLKLNKDIVGTGRAEAGL